jgi:hypothetical protein
MRPAWSWPTKLRLASQRQSAVTRGAPPVAISSGYDTIASSAPLSAERQSSLARSRMSVDRGDATKAPCLA